jgi:xanthine dehydrogenase FAD-binding subunit
MLDGYRPANLLEALNILAERECTPIAGGTDLMVQHARGTGVRPVFDKPLLFISHLKELQNIDVKNNTIYIGAAATLTQLLEHSHIPGIFKEILRQMAAAPTRHMATLAGNIDNASPAGDTLPYLYAIDAELVLRSRNGERILGVADYICGPKQTVRKKDELMTEIRIPLSAYNLQHYRKLGQRKGMSLTKASFLGLAKTTSGRIEDIRIALGSVAPQIVRSREIEQSLKEKTIPQVQKLKSGIIQDYAPLILPIDDARSTAHYRKQVSLRLIRDFIERLH